jgi:hypothetical protein
MRRHANWIAGCVVLGGWVLMAAARWANAGAAGDSGIQIEQGSDALIVRIDGKLFTRYVFSGAPKPYCWPIIGPTGDAVTRAYPMESVAGEKEDHPHQRSLWFTHGLVNGVDFWSEGPKAGRQVHRAFELVQGGSKLGRIRAITDWIAPDGSKVAEDTRELRFHATSADRTMDFDITIRASEGPVTFGDTKEGMFGVRVASSMDVDQKGRSEGGQIVNARGLRDAEAWGKPSEWVDYSGPVDGKLVGITIMSHPSSFRHPTHWHVRTYGLFAANPFGLHDFYGDRTKDGSHTVPEGESITFRYRLWFHAGGVDSTAAYAAYAQ